MSTNTEKYSRIAHLRNASYRFGKARDQFALGAREMVQADIGDKPDTWDGTLASIDELLDAVELLIQKHTPTGKIDKEL